MQEQGTRFRRIIRQGRKGKIRSRSIYSNDEYQTFGVNINGWTTSYSPRPEFFITDFSPEALTKINFSKNQTGYIFAMNTINWLTASLEQRL